MSDPADEDPAAPPPASRHRVPRNWEHKQTGLTLPNYEYDVEQIRKFIEGSPEYQQQLQDVKDRKITRFVVNLTDIEDHYGTSDFSSRIERNTMKYAELFAEILDDILAGMTASPESSDRANLSDQDIISHYEMRKRLEQEDAPDVPDGFTRRHVVNFAPRAKMPVVRLRDVRSDCIGRLVLTRGIVCRVSDVQCEVQYACYVCDRCAHEEFVEVTDTQFMPHRDCPNCKQGGSTSDSAGGESQTGVMNFNSRGSRFDKFQEVVIQEVPDEVPVGGVPRKIKVYCRGRLTRLCSPGDRIFLTGVFLQNPMYQFRHSYSYVVGTYIEAMDIQHEKLRYSVLREDRELSSEVAAFVRSNSSQKAYERLAMSIAPEIHGLLDVKKALLLQLVAGVTKTLPSGIKIRGDINICLCGDPGVGKSQLLKYIAKIAPRGVYTTGKGSSGVGLTAAVLRDKLTGEYVLEGGALVLADNGTCCIDEFDKMHEEDVTALHEVMEQQSISVAKAGITTTLNARASILAAANPQWSRYNRKRSVVENIAMPSALLSRFDLIFLLLDKNDRELNLRMARHILNVHREGGSEYDERGNRCLTVEFIKAFIAHAKTHKPMIPRDPAMRKFIADVYTEMREQGGTNEIYGSTPRTLLSILRLAQALAKLRFAHRVSQEDIQEARRLMDSCKAALLENYDSSRSARKKPSTIVFEIVRQFYEETKRDTFNLNDLSRQMQVRGLDKVVVIQALQEYAELNILTWDPVTEEISLVLG